LLVTGKWLRRATGAKFSQKTTHPGERNRSALVGPVIGSNDASDRRRGQFGPVFEASVLSAATLYELELTNSQGVYDAQDVIGHGFGGIVGMG